MQYIYVCSFLFFYCQIWFTFFFFFKLLCIVRRPRCMLFFIIEWVKKKKKKKNTVPVQSIRIPLSLHSVTRSTYIDSYYSWDQRYFKCINLLVARASTTCSGLLLGNRIILHEYQKEHWHPLTVYTSVHLLNFISVGMRQVANGC